MPPSLVLWCLYGELCRAGHNSPYAEARVMRRERSLLLLGSTIIGD
jgi:hypothetical protein